jgi:hypothetical protein
MDSRARLAPSLELVHRVTEAAAAYTIARMRILERIPGNPIGIAVRTVDNVVALMAQHLPSLAFNSFAATNVTVRIQYSQTKERLYQLV